jgi:hypothetical protein
MGLLESFRVVDERGEGARMEENGVCCLGWNDLVMISVVVVLSLPGQVWLLFQEQEKKLSVRSRRAVKNEVKKASIPFCHFSAFSRQCHERIRHSPSGPGPQQQPPAQPYCTDHHQGLL